MYNLQPVYIDNNQPQNDDELGQFLAQLQASGKANDLFNPQIGYTNDQLREGITNGLNYGNKDIANYIDRNNIRKPETEEDIELARLGKFNTPEIKGGLSQEINPQPQQKSGFFAGYRDNYDNGFAPSNLQKGNKTWGYRLGEGLGTVGRFIDSPLGRGVLAAGLNSALGYDNSALEGLTAASGRQNAVTADRLYRNELKKYGYTDDELADIRGTITSDMYKNLVGNMYKFRNLDQNTYLKLRKYYDDQLKNGSLSPEQYQSNIDALNNQYVKSQAQTIQAGQVQESNQTRNTNSQIEYRDKRLQQYDEAINQVDRKIALTAANSAERINLAKERLALIEQKNQYIIEEKQKKEQKQQQRAADLAEFQQILSGKDQKAKDFARNAYIKRYGEDPLKKVELY